VGESAAATAVDGVHSFPVALTSFVGRDEAVGKVAGLLAEHRLVTVTGPAGVGKTRLAGEVVRRVAHRFADGVWLAELALVGDPAQVPSAVAAALEVREQPGMPAAGVLAQVLAQRQILLVLDNCEHVLGTAAALCSGLLAAADDVRVLATSREALAVAGEVRYRLAPLRLPDLSDPARAARAEAVALFVDRARSADARFTLTGETTSAAAELVTRLDGMPLAIELAAARVEALGLGQLLDRLDDRLRLLAVGDRGVARHGSLAAAVEWSYRLLGEQEQQVFRRVSVFPGPFTLEAAEAVAGAGATEAMLRLVDCSLLVPPRTGPDGRARYVMLETLRAYGVSRLADADEQLDAAAALAGFALQVGEQAAAGLAASTGEAAAGAWLDGEDATVHQGLAWALEHDPAAALRLAVALAPWWRLRGRSAEGSRWLRTAAGYGVPGSSPWCAAQFWLGQNAMHAGDFAGAVEDFGAVCEMPGGRVPSQALADCLGGRAAALLNMGRAAEGARDARRALDLARELGYPAAEALALVGMNMAADYAGDLQEAAAWARQAGQLDPAAVPGWLLRVSRMILTEVLIGAGELAAARRAAQAGLALSRPAGDLSEQTYGLLMMAMLDRLAGDLPGAGAYLHDAARLAARIGDRMFLSGSTDEGGYLCAAAGRCAEAVTLWAAHAAWLRRDHITEAPHETDRRREPLGQAIEALGPERAREAEERGAAMTLETAAEFVAVLFAPSPQAPPGGAKLSARERELVTLVARGHTNAEIARQLFISVRTVASHLDRIRDKTGCRRRADLTRLALAEGLV
jgi:predicted ATPase/DNA-binding CsgD family transcriptional regulator